MDYESIELLVRQAGQKLYQARPTRENIHKKEGLANFCTDFDTAIQKFLIEELEKLLPGAAFSARRIQRAIREQRPVESIPFILIP